MRGNIRRGFIHPTWGSGHCKVQSVHFSAAFSGQPPPPPNSAGSQNPPLSVKIHPAIPEARVFHPSSTIKQNNVAHTPPRTFNPPLTKNLADF
ncbi:uncharacterized protein K444DRAFT_614020 [Hyaloscypha bicolor E]|uniref:Uncharacterized protein n=1 Tax=Hyaloscypha bicolor E TaxID=1095630 RepID=A0A2J6T885_9HELO|nr:uncharacterized protein K444DRAFT_614020 [Hyaloscypha bicolor E]PMD59230.1 hypothetical protein K444DRAFT_614020 [Hyaloscypha bicolor E]